MRNEEKQVARVRCWPEFDANFRQTTRTERFQLEDKKPGQVNGEGNEPNDNDGEFVFAAKKRFIEKRMDKGKESSYVGVMLPDKKGKLMAAMRSKEMAVRVFTEADTDTPCK